MSLKSCHLTIENLKKEIRKKLNLVFMSVCFLFSIFSVISHYYTTQLLSLYIIIQNILYSNFIQYCIIIPYSWCEFFYHFYNVRNIFCSFF